MLGGGGEEEGGDKRAKGLSVYRSLGVNVVSGRKFVCSHSNLYATVHVGGGFGRTATVWNCKVFFFFFFFHSLLLDFHCSLSLFLFFVFSNL